MHSAPAVSYPVGRSRLAACLLLLAWVLGAAGTASWWFQADSPGWRLPAALLVLAAAGAFAARQWWKSRPGTLAWDGEGWSWLSEGVASTGVPKVSLDLQHCLLLRWTSANARDWFWLERAGRAEHWDDLRRAVYSRARIEALPEPRAPAAKP